MRFCNVDKDAIGGLGCRIDFGRNSFINIINSENQKDLLMKQKAIFKNRLNLINNQLNTLQDDK